MSEEYQSLFMYLVEGTDSNGDPIRALVTAKDPANARAKVKGEYDGTLTRLGTRRITGHEWDELLKGYGSEHSRPYVSEGYPAEASRFAIREGQPVFF